jgi:long-chain acyl-CoA synthetase
MKLATANKLNSLEKPKQITLLMDPFTIESDLLTPTMKLKRNIAKDKFKEQIIKMYESKPMT